MKPDILIVDDDESIRTQMKWALAEDYSVHMAGDREALMKSVSERHPAVVLLDLGLPPEPNKPDEGLKALGEAHALDSFAKVIVITGQGEKDVALRAIGEGAYDFLVKPIDMDELKIILKRAFHVARLERECHDLQQHAQSEGFQGMLGASPQMQETFGAIKKVATTDVPVLILGESGTGKEMAARAIHNLSARREGPFVAINCSAIPETLLESELFGHEKGSFTGAHAQRRGRIESALAGTLFLDEIGELPPAIQVKLLRFLQEKCIERVGGRQEIEIDARVVAATNADLRQSMVQNRFREDLYYRLAVFVLRMPPLRDRSGDIPVMATAFLRRFAAQNKSKVTGFHPRTIRAMETYRWPGNVREMENRISRAVIMAEGRSLKPSDLELGVAANEYEGVTLKEARESLERDIINRAMNRHRHNISRAATELGISRPTLYELMDKLGIPRSQAQHSDGA